MDCTSYSRNSSDSRGVIAEDIVLSAITRESLESLRKLCQKLCVNFRLLSAAVDLDGRNALHMAASCGKQDIIEWFVKEQGFDVDARDLESNWTALHRSLFYGHLNCAIKLLQLGADPSLCDKDDLTPLELVMFDCPYKLTNTGLSWSKYKFEVDLSPHITERLEVYTWGINSNFTLGHGDENSRKNPELLEAISGKREISVIEVIMSKFHSVFLTAEGQVFTCGHGWGGRLGHGDETTLLIPRKIEGLPGDVRCAAVAGAQNHTVLLTEDGDIFTFGLNDQHQLGHSPPPTKCLIPKQVVHKSLKEKKMVGIAAGQYHTVMYSKKEVYTCGLNAGQLGHPKGEATQIVPRQVSSLHLKDIVIHTVSCSDAATLCATKKGDIYLLNQFTCRKIISRFSGLRSLKIAGGELQIKTFSNTMKHVTEEMQVILLNTRGQVYRWLQRSVNVKRCKWLLKRSLNVTSIAVGKKLMISTDQGEAFFCYESGADRETASKSTQQHGDFSLLTIMEETDKRLTVPFRVERIPMIHRVAKVMTEPNSKSFAVLQVDSREGLKSMPSVSKPMVSVHLLFLFEEAVVEDTIHDVEINLKGHVIPAHSFILASRSPTLQKILLGNEENIPESCHRHIRRIKLDDSNDYRNVIKWLQNLYSCKSIQDKDILPKSELSKAITKEENDAENNLCTIKHSRRTNGERSDLESSDLALVDELGGGEFPCTDLCDVSLQIADDGDVSQDDLKLLQNSDLLSASKIVSSRRSRKFEKAKTKKSGYLQEDNIKVEHYTLNRHDCPELHDVVVEADDGTQFQCHKCVLVARLDYFRSMFCCEWLESGSQAKTLKMPILACVLEIILGFIYSGQAPALKGCKDIEFLGNVLVLADQLLIGRLKEICEAEMANLVSFRNVVELLEFTCVYNANQLKQVCMEFICNNLNSLLETRALDRLSKETLVELSKKYRSMIPAMAWRFICPDDLHLPFVQSEDEQTSPIKTKRKHSGGRRKRSSKSEGDIESEVTSPSQKTRDAELENEQEKHTSEYTNKIKQQDASVGLVTVKDEELHKNVDLTSSDGSEQDSPRAESVEVLKNEETGKWYRKEAETPQGKTKSESHKTAGNSPVVSLTPPRSQAKNIPRRSPQSTTTESGALSPMKKAWDITRVSSPPGSSLKEIMEQEEHFPEHQIVPGSSKRKTSAMKTTISPTEVPSSSFVSVKWETGAKQSQKQRKKKTSVSETETDPKQREETVKSPTSPETNVCPWGSIPKHPASVKSIRELIEEEKKKETPTPHQTKTASKIISVSQSDNPIGARKKLSWGLHRQVPILKDVNGSGKEANDQSDTPTRAWQTKMASSPPSPSPFSNILQSQEEENTNLDKARKKPLNLIQIEDQAIEELLNYYGGKYNPCELVIVERITTATAAPVWKKERSLSTTST